MKYYVVLEVQATENSAPSVLTSSYTDKFQAYQQYHSVLSFAAVSQVPYHGAYIFGKDGDEETFESKFFNHRTTEEE